MAALQECRRPRLLPPAGRPQKTEELLPQGNLSGVEEALDLEKRQQNPVYLEAQFPVCSAPKYCVSRGIPFCLDLPIITYPEGCSNLYSEAWPPRNRMGRSHYT